MAILALRVTPRASKAGIGEWRDGADGRRELEVRVAAAPTDGAANAAVTDLLAEALDLARRDVRLVSGAASRHKRVEIALDDEEMMRRLERR